jgi:uncharacterized repeat protein (TIGR01451 family)
VVGSLRVTTPPAVRAFEYDMNGVWDLVPSPDARAFRILWDVIGPRQTVTVTFLVELDAAIPPIDIWSWICNAAYICDDSGLCDQDYECTQIPIPGLSVIKSVSAALTVYSQTITYTLVASNIGNVALSSVTLTDTLPAGLSYANQASPAEPDRISGQTQVWDDITGGAGLAPGARLTVTFQAMLDAGADACRYVNTITGTGRHPGGVVIDTDSEGVMILPSVELDNSLAAQDVDAGLVTFTIVVSNTGPSTLDVLPLSDAYNPRHLSFMTADPMPDAPADDGRLDWTDLTTSPNGFGANLAPGEQFAITAVFSIVQDIATTNVASVTNVIDVCGNRANSARDPTFVELVYFRVERFPGYVSLAWKTAVEVDHYGFYLLRSTTHNLRDAVEIGFIPAAGYGRGGGATYAFKDMAVSPGVSYVYWLVDLDIGGRRTVHPPVLAPPLALPYRIYMPFLYYR